MLGIFMLHEIKVSSDQNEIEITWWGLWIQPPLGMKLISHRQSGDGSALVYHYMYQRAGNEEKDLVWVYEDGDSHNPWKK
jgi:hypothetical protein